MNVTNLFSSLSGLASVHRFSMTKMCQPESVLEHSGWVAFVVVILAKEINVIEKDTIDVADALTMALMHDVDEIVTGDVPRPTKYRSQDTIKAFKEMSRWGVAKVITSLDLDKSVGIELLERHSLAKKGKNGLVVAIADCMAVVYKLWEEVIVRNNCSMTNHGKPLLEQIGSLKEKTNDTFHGPVSIYLLGILGQCEKMVCKVIFLDDPIFGSGMRT
jgi:5'-deoxynucleotidase YfbR-like HD superfamily hydrolase